MQVIILLGLLFVPSFPLMFVGLVLLLLFKSLCESIIDPLEVLFAFVKFLKLFLHIEDECPAIFASFHFSIKIIRISIYSSISCINYITIT